MGPRSRLGVFIAVSGAISVLALVAPTEMSDPVVLLWSLLCSVLMITAARRHRGTTRRTAWLLAGAASLTAIGFLVRGIHGEMVGEPQPMPSPADFIHIPAYVLFVLTALHVHRSRSTRRDLDAWLDAAALILALFIMMWVTFLGDFVLDSSLDPGLRVLNSVYNLLIYSAGTVFLRITSTPGHRPVSYYILGVAGIAYIVSDIAATYSLARGTGLTLAVALSPIVYGLAAAAIRHPSAAMLAVPHEEEELRVGSLRLFIVALTILTPLITFGHDGGRVSSLVLICSASLLAGLVVTRVVRLLRQQQEASDLDRALSTELAQLAALDSASAIVARIPDAAERLL
ncbi:MAG: hypothetical protein HKO87_02670, partial [Acidimicrobiia bacterium]|nr:hypothetical protein [Acidimicrobiia bacterium]